METKNERCNCNTIFMFCDNIPCKHVNYKCVTINDMPVKSMYNDNICSNNICDDNISNNVLLHRNNKNNNDIININNNNNKNEKNKNNIKIKNKLLSYYDNNKEIIEIGIDESGRGPMLGRVYTAAVILPKDDTFNHSLMKDSKRFYSEKKIKEMAEYIKRNAIMWSVDYCENYEIDKINIRNATHKSMHKSIFNVLKNLNCFDYRKCNLLVDGNDFKPFTLVDNNDGLVQVSHNCIEGGDNKYSSIAAASILAKVERDKYIEELCNKHPLLEERYGILTNKGYGTKTHMKGIKNFGISQFHRISFGICKNEKLNYI